MGYEKRQFLYGMDLDTEERLIEPGFSRKNVNVRIGSSTDNGVYSAENIQGNTFIPNTELPSGTNKVIGSCWDKLRDLSYYFVYNSEGDHGIFEYNHVEGKITQVMIASVLNFQPDKLITGHNVVEFDENNHLLYFTDGFNPPRKINIERARPKNRSTPLGEKAYDSPITEDVIDAIKYPPLFPPTFEYVKDTDQKNNYLVDKIFQFKAAYVYDDKEESAYSPISVQAIAEDFNVIRVTIPRGGQLAERVILAVRVGNLGDFVQVVDQDVRDYTKDGEGNYIYDFRNDKHYNSISLTKSNKLFDSLPQVAKAQEYIEGNRMAYGNITEGYDNVDVDLNLTLNHELPKKDSDVNNDTDSGNKTSVKGFIRISNGAEGLSGGYNTNQILRKDESGAFTFFGGFGPKKVTPQSNNQNATSTQGFADFNGFVVYLAGTDFNDVSRQGNTNKSCQNNDGIYVGTGETVESEIRSVINSPLNSLAGMDGVVGAFSTFEIQDVPDGEYFLRVAESALTNKLYNDDKKAYQKTSTNVRRISHSGYGGLSFEDLRTGGFLKKPQNNKELLIKIKDGKIENAQDTIEIVIEDLTHPVKPSKQQVNLAGYVANFVKDDNSFYNPTSVADAYARSKIENCEIKYIDGEDETRFTHADHNGYFFIQNAKKITSIKVGQTRYDCQGYVYNNPTEYYPGTLDTIDGVLTNYTYLWVVASRSIDIKKYERVSIRAELNVPGGQRESDIFVSASRGSSVRTNDQGVAYFLRYNDPYTNNNPFGGRLNPMEVTTVPIVPDGKNGYYEPPSYTQTILIGESSGGENYQNNDEVVTIIFQLKFNDASSSGDSDSDSGSDFIKASDVLLNPSCSLKNGGVYSFGIVYYDRANRSGVTNIGKDLVLPFYTEANLPLRSIPYVGWEIKNLAPDWATHYQIVRTQNTSLNSYLQWYTSEVSYTSDLFDRDFSNATNIVLTIKNLTDAYRKENPDSILVYDFIPGDRIRFISDNDGKMFTDYVDSKVLSFDSTTGELTVKNNTPNRDLSSGVFFEIYSPKLDVTQNVYYEIGECYKVLKHIKDDGQVISYHQGQLEKGGSNQDPLNPSSKPATGFLKGGDTYYRKRDIVLKEGEVIAKDIDSQLYSDFWQSKISDIGRPSIIDQNAKRVNRITTIYYSDRFIPETNINGLNSFFDTAFETYDRKYGSIQKLFSQDKRLDCYQETKSGKILVEENVIFDQFDQGTIGSSSKVLSKIIYYKGDYGTLNPESFVENEGRRYWFDIRNGKVLRLSNDGITPLSDKKMHGYFESKTNFYSAFNLLPEVWGVFDENFDEYIIAFGSVSRPEGFTPDELALVSSQADQITETRDGLTFTFDILYSANQQGVPTEFEVVRDLSNGTFVINSVAGDITLDRQKLLAIPAETLGFSEKTGHWTSFYSYDPECMIRAGVDFLSFKNGQAYLHNTSNAKRNSFYGEERGSEVWAVFNQNPSNVKVFQALSEESDSVWQVRDIFTQGGQRSNLTKDDFSVAYGQGHTLYSKENIHYAPFWKDENTPNVDNPLIEGDSLRDVSILVKLINDSTKEERLFAASINYSLSERSNR